jgi:hypothetical protein
MVLVTEYTESVQSTDGPLISGRTFIGWPGKLIMTERILTARVQKCDALHLYRYSVQTGNVVRQHHVSSEERFAGVGITLGCQVGV